jgi:hypothetical protein
VARALVLGLVVLAAGGFLLLKAVGAQATCFSDAPCTVPTDAWEPYRLGGALLLLVAGSALMLSGLWRWYV